MKKVIDYRKGAYALRILRGEKTIYIVGWFKTPEEAEKFWNFCIKNKLSPWQMDIAMDLLKGYKVHLYPVIWGKRFTKFRKPYVLKIKKVADLLGAKYVPGPRGGKTTGYYFLPPEKRVIIPE